MSKCCKSIIFSLASFVLLFSADCFAANVTVTLNVGFGGVVHDSNDHPLGGASVTVFARRNGLTIPNSKSYSWMSSNVSGASFGIYGSSSMANAKTIDLYLTKVGTSTTTTYVDFDYVVRNYQGSTILNKRITRAVVIENINPLILDGQTFSYDIDLTNEELKQNLVVTGPTGGTDAINTGSISNNGIKDYSIVSKESIGTIVVNWKSEGFIPKDHWVVISEADSIQEPSCQSGFKLGKNTTNSTSFSLSFAPEKYGVNYRVKICTIYNTTNDAPGICATATAGYYQDCDISLTGMVLEGGGIEKFGNVQIANNFHPTAAMSYDWGSLKESWFYSTSKAQWFYYVPGSTTLDGGKLYSNTYDPPVSGVIAKQNFMNNVSLDILQANLTFQTAGFVYDKMFRDQPLAVRVPSVMGNIEESTATEEARFLAFDYSLGASRAGVTNWSQVYNEKWLFAEKKEYTEATTQAEKNKNWLYVLPSGAVYRWDGVSAGANLTGTFVMKLTQRYYDFLDKTVDLHEAYVQRVYGFESNDPNFSYDFNHLNRGGTAYYEKWIRSRRNGAWYYILPGGAIYKWDGTYPIKFTNKVGVLPHSSYRDPNTELLNFPYTP